MSEPIVDASLYACLFQAAFATAPASQALTAIAAEFSPRYEQHRPDLVSIDVRGLSRLLGTPKMIGAELRREAASRGLLVHVAVAPTRMAALVLAVARPGLTVVSANGMADALASVPLSALAPFDFAQGKSFDSAPFDSAQGKPFDSAQDKQGGQGETMAVFKRWGVRTLGELAALSAADLSARLGRSGRIWQAIARGEELRPLVPMQAEERFEGTLELEWPIDAAEPLSFVLTRLLEPLSTRLERHDRGAAVLHVTLGLVTRDVHACRIELPSPLRDVRALRTLALLDLESRPPSAAIDRVTVTIEPTPGRILQHTLFTRPHPTPEQLSTLLARLGALMGQDRIGAPALVDSSRPGAFQIATFQIDERRLPSTPAPSFELPPPTSALRRCRQPIPARVATDAHQRPLRVSTDRRGFAGGGVLACAGPWRTSGAWWEEDGSRKLAGEDSTDRSAYLAEAQNSPMARRRDGGPVAPKRQSITGRAGGPWSRDEWDVSLADGAVYRIFRDRVTDGWFIDGVVD